MSMKVLAFVLSCSLIAMDNIKHVVGNAMMADELIVLVKFMLLELGEVIFEVALFVEECVMEQGEKRKNTSDSA